jgi:hypothetical protein
MRSVFKIEHHSEVKKRYKAEMAAKDKSLNFACPICGAQPQEKCELNSGTPRFESHRERRDTAKAESLRDKARAAKIRLHFSGRSLQVTE